MNYSQNSTQFTVKSQQKLWHVT